MSGSDPDGLTFLAHLIRPFENEYGKGLSLSQPHQLDTIAATLLTLVVKCLIQHRRIGHLYHQPMNVI